MGNWDLVVSYDERAASWLAQQGYPHPPVAAGNRMPTVGEIKSVQHEGLRFDVDDDDDARVVESFRMRGDCELEVRALHTLSQRCGQLWMYPDTGAPAIVIVPAMDVDHAARALREAHERCSRSASDDEDGGWRWLHDELYGDRAR